MTKNRAVKTIQPDPLADHALWAEINVAPSDQSPPLKGRHTRKLKAGRRGKR